MKQMLNLMKIIGFRRSCLAIFAKLCKNDLKYIEIIKEFIKAQNEDLIDKTRKAFANWEKTGLRKNEPLVMWVLWWQGLANMPDVVKLCYESQKKIAKTKNAKLILLTKNNINEYIDIPQFILDKVAEKKITLTHFSDIIRIFLLEKYGGAWIDSTLFLNSGLYNTQFEQYDFFSFHISPKIHKPKGVGQNLTECKWAGFMLYSKHPHYPLFLFLKESIVHYWEKYDSLVDYFIMNFLIRVLYENVEEMTNAIDSIEYNNPCLYKLSQIMNNQYSENTWISLRQHTDFFKLSWKEKYEKIDSERHATFYGKICSLMNGEKND